MAVVEQRPYRVSEMKEDTESPILVDDIEGCSWWVVHTKSRREKRVRDECARMKIRYYLPLYRKYTRNRQRTVSFDVPLFSGYVFVYTGAEGRLEIQRTNYVANILQVSQTEQLLGELRQVDRALRESMHLEPFGQLRRGTPVRVKQGPMSGVEGVIVQRKSTYKLVLQVDFIRRNVAVEVDIGDVEPV